MEPLILEPLILLSGRRAGKMRLRHSASGINGSTCGVKLENLMGGDLSRAFATGATERKGERRRQAHTRSSLQIKQTPRTCKQCGRRGKRVRPGLETQLKVKLRCLSLQLHQLHPPLRPT